MYRGEEEEEEEKRTDEDEGEREVEEDDNDDDDEEETITIEGVRPLGRRRCSSILFLVDAPLVRAFVAPVPLYSFFYPPFAPSLSPIGASDGLFA